MSQISIAASRFLSSPTGAFGTQLRAPSASSGVGAAGLRTSAASASLPANVDDVNSSSGGGGGAGAMTAAGSGSAVIPVGAAGTEMSFSQDLTGMTETEAESRPRLPSNFSEAGPSEAGYSDAASRYDSTPVYNHHQGSRGGAHGAHNRSGLVLEPATPNSAAGSRFDTSSPGSAMTFTSRVGIGSPTSAAGPRGALHVGAGAGGGASGGPMTGRSVASSMRSDGGSSFFRGGGAGGASQRSGDSRGVGISSASNSSWDEEDLQNMGTRWLADRAYNQQFDEHK